MVNIFSKFGKTAAKPQISRNFMAADERRRHPVNIFLVPFTLNRKSGIVVVVS